MLTDNKVLPEYPNSLKMRSQNFVSGISGAFHRLFFVHLWCLSGLFRGTHRTISEFYSTHCFVRDSVRLGAFVIVFFCFLLSFSVPLKIFLRVKVQNYQYISTRTRRKVLGRAINGKMIIYHHSRAYMRAINRYQEYIYCVHVR